MRIRRKLPLAIICAAVLAALLGAAGLSGILNPNGSSVALASTTTLTVLKGAVQVQVKGTGSWAPASDGMTLRAGDAVETAAGSHAYITFFEGSTITLQPETSLVIQQLEMGQQGQGMHISLFQWAGSTWSRVVKMVGGSSRYEIETPSAAALVRGTRFTLEVGADGSSRVQTAEGAVAIVAQGQEVMVPQGLETSVPVGEPPAPPQPSPPPKNQLVVSLEHSGAASVTGPNGGSVGFLPDGSIVETIPGAILSPPGVYPQTITIPNAVGGDYQVVVRGDANGTPALSVQAQSDGRTIFENTSNVELGKGTQMGTVASIQATAGTLTSAALTGVAPVQGKGPERTAAVKAPDAKPELPLAAGVVDGVRPSAQATTETVQPTANVASQASGRPSPGEPEDAPAALPAGQALAADDAEVWSEQRNEANAAGAAPAQAMTAAPGLSAADSRPIPPGLAESSQPAGLALAISGGKSDPPGREDASASASPGGPPADRGAAVGAGPATAQARPDSARPDVSASPPGSANAPGERERQDPPRRDAAPAQPNPAGQQAALSASPGRDEPPAKPAASGSQGSPAKPGIPDTNEQRPLTDGRGSSGPDNSEVSNEGLPGAGRESGKGQGTGDQAPGNDTGAIPASGTVLGPGDEPGSGDKSAPRGEQPSGGPGQAPGAGAGSTPPSTSPGSWQPVHNPTPAPTPGGGADIAGGQGGGQAGGQGSGGQDSDGGPGSGGVQAPGANQGGDGDSGGNPSKPTPTTAPTPMPKSTPSPTVSPTPTVPAGGPGQGNSPAKPGPSPTPVPSLGAAPTATPMPTPTGNPSVPGTPTPTPTPTSADPGQGAGPGAGHSGSPTPTPAPTGTPPSNTTPIPTPTSTAPGGGGGQGNNPNNPPATPTPTANPSVPVTPTPAPTQPGQGGGQGGGPAGGQGGGQGNNPTPTPAPATPAPTPTQPGQGNGKNK